LRNGTHFQNVCGFGSLHCARSRFFEVSALLPNAKINDGVRGTVLSGQFGGNAITERQCHEAQIFG
jgi:hypothetical protein